MSTRVVQWMRSCRITVNGMVVEDIGNTGLRLAFRAYSTARIEPSFCEARAWNLQDTTRARLSQTQDNLVQAGQKGSVKIEAGYGKTAAQIFGGQILKLRHEWADGEWVTIIEGGDSIAAYQTQVSESFAPGVPVDSAVSVLAAAMKIAEGSDVKTAIAGAMPGAKISAFKHGYVVTGSASEEMTRLLEDLGLGWRIEDGQLVVYKQRETTLDFAVVLTPSTGLLGEPTMREAGRVTAVALVNPALKPGRQVVIQNSQGVPFGAGTYRVDIVEHVGDTRAQEWTSTCTCRPALL